MLVKANCVRIAAIAMPSRPAWSPDPPVGSALRQAFVIAMAPPLTFENASRSGPVVSSGHKRPPHHLAAWTLRRNG